MLRSALRFIAGAIVASIAWVLLSPAYNAVAGFAAQPIVRVDRRLRSVEVRALGNRVQARGGEGQLDLPRVVIPADQLTYNIVLLVGLFATERGLFRGRMARRFLISMLILFATHVLAFAISIESTYATAIANWSASHYSPHEQDFWTSVEYSYRLAGLFAIAFGLWWLSAPEAFQKSRERSAS